MKALCVLFSIVLLSRTALAQEVSLRNQAAAALQRGVQFFRSQVAVEGTYLWQYSEDLSKREGETKATATQGWVQPPGTPAAGLAFFAAWQATSNNYFLDAAKETSAPC